MGLTQLAKGGFPDLAPVYHRGGNCLGVCILVTVQSAAGQDTALLALAGMVKAQQ